jgi:hypothetical protein
VRCGHGHKKETIYVTGTHITSGKNLNVLKKPTVPEKNWYSLCSAFPIIDGLKKMRHVFFFNFAS